ncbi:3'(2'),5'-bisphosphate nucleotidase CysQ family protein [Candidatus Uabimicrobium amorphum]|uniref:Inositol monophosphatase n=1 Tax=Uabimicrobium amorphum TaxID=2596890 RepID=A0A5S9IK45_UABAM|nr:inositol monophosphatase family protein [Candidatus Uabimicrobium amorphum]BBM82065.1 inositol monophosphatase [Candidatus Uabimicrobium amorphum]
MDTRTLKTLAKIAIDAAIQAGVMIQKYADRDIVVKEKDSGHSRASQIVTEVDFLSQEIILQLIQPTCKKYNLGLLIEESDDDLSRFQKDYFWCIDPLDGTLPFVEKRRGYAVAIALVSRESTPYLGVIYDPPSSTLYHAIKDVGSFRNNEFWKWKPTYNGTYQQIDRGGAVMNACWVLENAPACFVKKPKPQQGGGCLWDYAATACLFNEMSAFVGDSYGKPLDLNSRASLYMNKKGVVYASHREIAQRHISSITTDNLTM